MVSQEESSTCSSGSSRSLRKMIKKCEEYTLRTQLGRRKDGTNEREEDEEDCAILKDH
jgi:hypothetical protein